MENILNTIDDNLNGIIPRHIELRLRTAALLNKTDEFISNTEKMLDQFEKDDEEWRREGRALGFDF